MKEQIYNDFITKVLPTIQQGLTITKDYFLDLFGRYIKYLIVSDSIGILFSLASIVLGLFLLKKTKKMWDVKTEYIKAGHPYDDHFSEGVFVACSLAVIIFGIVSTVVDIDNLIKDIYIPEIRVYETLQNYKNHVPNN